MRYNNHDALKWQCKMTQSPAKIVVHVVTSTKKRKPLLPEFIHDDLYAYTVGVLNTIDASHWPSVVRKITFMRWC